MLHGAVFADAPGQGQSGAVRQVLVKLFIAQAPQTSPHGVSALQADHSLQQVPGLTVVVDRAVVVDIFELVDVVVGVVDVVDVVEVVGVVDVVDVVELVDVVAVVEVVDVLKH